MRSLRSLLLGVAAITAGEARADSLIGELVRRFSASQFELVRGNTDVPFLPLGWVTLTGYERVDVLDADGRQTGLQYQQLSASEGALLALPVGQWDLFGIGEWAETTSFRAKTAPAPNIDVFSLAVPVGWAHQLKHNWQLAAFVAPVGHKSSEDGWYWEAMGGLFGRYTSSERTAWLFGAYFDVSSFSQFYTPYAGATFNIGAHWAIDVVVPWPGVTYAPTANWFVRIGAAAADNSWTFGAQGNTPRVSVTGIDVGIHTEHRVYRDVWFGLEAGVSGLRGFTLSGSGSGWQPVEGNLSGKGYALLTVTLRPSARLVGEPLARK
ncbi:MAG TPA: hypothetical protein VGM84_13705 [Steroidobacteraceae bacterium]|jgi:hypothetical protein